MKHVLTVTLLLISLVGYSPSLSKQVKEKEFELFEREYERELRIQEIKSSEFDIELLKEYMDICYPKANEIIIKQFILETGWFSSRIFKENNNICGMRLPKVRNTLAIGEKYNHAVYHHWSDSVDDYFLWLEYYKMKGHNTNQYCNFLEDIGYATASNYIKTLKKIKCC